MNTRIKPQEDRNKLTLKFHRGRLAVWPGSIIRWIEKDGSGEYSAPNVDGIGHVTATRLQSGTAERVMGALPGNAGSLLLQGFPIVVQRNQLPAFAANLV